MIVCRRPFTVYDVDVVGLAALAGVALVALFGVVFPAGAKATECRALADRIAAAAAEAERTDGRLRQVQTDVGRLQNGVAERERAAPKPGALTPLLQRVARLADEGGVRITQVLPSPIRKVEGCRIGEVCFSGQGTSLDFARLLDQLARENPYSTLQDFSIVHAGDPSRLTAPPETGAGDPQCRLSWTLRLHMLEGESSDPARPRARLGAGEPGKTP